MWASRRVVQVASLGRRASRGVSFRRVAQRVALPAASTHVGMLADAVACRSFATSEKGYTPAPFMRKMLKGALRVLGYYGGAATRERYSWLLFQSVEDQAGQAAWFQGKLGLPDTFQQRHALILLHAWMVHNRMKTEYDNGGKEMIEQFFDRVWEDATRRIRTLGVPEITVNKHLKGLQQHSFGALVNYDEGLSRTDDDEHFLGSALWRNVFEQRDVPDEHVLLLAAYCRREIAALHKVPVVDVYAGLIPWGPIIGESTQERDTRQQSVLDGEWRQAISEGGETYYWHTRTRETTWEKPEAMVEQEASREQDVEKWERLARSQADGASSKL